MVSIFTPIVLVLVVVMMVLTGSAGAVTTLEITHGFAALILPGQANDVSWSFGGVDWHTSGSNAGLSFDLSTGFIEIEGVSYVQCPNNPFSPPPCDQHSNIDLGGNFDEPFQWLHEASVAYDAGDGRTLSARCQRRPWSTFISLARASRRSSGSPWGPNSRRISPVPTKDFVSHRI